MFIIDYKFEKLWKYIDRLASLLDSNPEFFFSNIFISIKKTIYINLCKNISIIEIKLNKKKIYINRFEYANKIIL